MHKLWATSMLVSIGFATGAAAAAAVFALGALLNATSVFDVPTGLNCSRTAKPVVNMRFVQTKEI